MTEMSALDPPPQDGPCIRIARRIAKPARRCYRTRPTHSSHGPQLVKPMIAIACALLLGLPQHSSAQDWNSTDAARELTALQYHDQPDNPTLGVRRLGETAIILKRKGTGACAGTWRDAVHQSAWFGRLAKCWQLTTPTLVRICPIAAGRRGTQSCIDVPKELFATPTGTAFQ